MSLFLHHISWKTIPESTFKLNKEDITVLHKCLNKLISTSYHPLDDSIFDSFLFHINQLHERNVLVQSVTLDKNVVSASKDFETFEECYDYFLDLFSSCHIVSKSNFSRIPLSQKYQLEKLYLKSKEKDGFLLENIREMVMEDSEKKLLFLNELDLKAWIVNVLSTYTTLRNVVQMFILKFINLISENRSSFLLLNDSGVFKMLFNLFRNKYGEMNFRCNFLEILTTTLKHEEGRSLIYQESDIWKKAVALELDKDTNYYYSKILHNFIIKFTILKHETVFNICISRKLYEILSMLDFSSRNQENFVHLLEFLFKILIHLCSYRSKYLPSSEASCIAKFVENEVLSKIENSVQFTLFEAAKYYQVETLLDRLSMDYDNISHTPSLFCAFNFMEINYYRLFDFCQGYFPKNETYNFFVCLFEQIELVSTIYLEQVDFFPCNSCNKKCNIVLCFVQFLNIFNGIIYSKNREQPFKYFRNQKKDLCTDILYRKINFINDDVRIVKKAFVIFRRIILKLTKTNQVHRDIVVKVTNILVGMDTHNNGTLSMSQWFQEKQLFTEWLYYIQDSLKCLLTAKLVYRSKVFRKDRWVTAKDFIESHPYIKITETLCRILIEYKGKDNENQIYDIIYTLKEYFKQLNKYLKSIPCSHPSYLDLIVSDLEMLFNINVYLESESWRIRDTVIEMLTYLANILKEESLHFNNIFQLSNIVKILYLCENDPERFVRATAVRFISNILCYDVTSHNVIIALNPIRILATITCSEEESIVREKAVEGLNRIYIKAELGHFNEIEMTFINKTEEILNYCMMYVAIKDLDATVRKTAIPYWTNALENILSKNVTLNILQSVTQIGVIKVILTIIWFEEELDVVNIFYKKFQHVRSHYVKGKVEDILYKIKGALCFNCEMNSKLVVSDTFDTDLNTSQSTSCLSINTSHGNEVFAPQHKKKKYNDSKTSEETIDSIINTNDAELVPMNNNGRYFTLHSKNKLQRQGTNHNFPKFHNKNTFFNEDNNEDELIYTMICLLLEDNYLDHFIKDKFGTTDETYRLKSVFNDILYYNFDENLVESIDCY